MSKRFFLLASLIFIGSCVFRFLDPVLVNDHYFWISGGRQILVYGEIPARDFTDPGYFLQHFASAGVQAIFGYRLFGEVLLSILVIAVGYVATFILAVRASRSLALGVIVTGLAMAPYLRLYNYPKVFFLPVGLLLGWAYVDRPSRGRLVILGLFTATAFLFRHDYGIYLGCATVALLVAHHWQAGHQEILRRVGLYTGVVAVPALLFFGFLQANRGATSYLGTATGIAQRETQASLNGIPPEFSLDWSSPLLRLESLGIDRARRRVQTSSTGSLFNDLRQRIPLPGLSIAPGLIRSANATPWLYWVFMALPYLTLLLLAVKRLRPPAGARGEPIELCKMLAAAALCAVATPFLLRAPLEARFADIAAPTAVLGAWLIRQWLGGARLVRPFARPGARHPQPTVQPLTGHERSLAAQVGRVLTVAVLLVLTLTSIATVAEGGDWLRRRALLGGQTAVADHVRQKLSALWESPPPRQLWPSSHTGLLTLTGYVYSCTRPTDKTLALSGFFPEFYFYAGRARARRDWPSTERIPIVVLDVQRFDVSDLPASVAAQYRTVTESSFGGDRPLRLLVHRDLTPSGTYAPLGLPCYA